MQFLQGDIELLDHVQNEVGQQSTAVCIEKTVQGTSEAVVGELSGGSAKERANLDFHGPGKGTYRSPQNSKKPVFALQNRSTVSNIDY
jgi:hypothetical protein